MRNAQETLVNEFVQDIMPFMAAAQEYNATHTKRYNRVYFAKTKDGKWGITLPGVFDIAHSANNCPSGYNNCDFATAWSMKVDQLLAMGDYTYLEWCKKYNYLNRGNKDWHTGAEYIRLVNPNEKSQKEYSLYIPQTGHGYVKLNHSEDEPNFTSLKDAIKRRNQVLYTMIMRRHDAYGELPENRVRKFSRVLVKGYFQATILNKQVSGLSREEGIARYESNLYRLINAFSNAKSFCEDEQLVQVFDFYENIFRREITLDMIEKFDSMQERLLEYFHAICLFSGTIDTIVRLSRNEMKRAAISFSGTLFKSMPILAKLDNATREEGVSRYESNLETFSNTFEMAARLIGGNLGEVFVYYERIFKREMTTDMIERFDDMQTRLLEYFNAIELHKEIIDVVIALSRTEKKKFAGKIVRLTTRGIKVV